MLQIRGMRPTVLARAYATGQRSVPGPTHVFLCVADHFEPEWMGADLDHQRRRVDRWLTDYPRTVDGCRDSRGQPPQHTFFYPIECYCEEHVQKLTGLAEAGYGDVEVHLHHDNDNAESLRDRLLSMVETLHSRHQLLTKDTAGQIRYGFIHGNWALDNSHPDGRWCGVNNELTILRETGCYADFTMPAAPDPAQTRTINSIYYATDDPDRPRSHDTGVPARRGSTPPAAGLLMIQGPLLLTHRRPWQKPRIENGNIAGTQPLLPDRIDDWLRARVAVVGHERWLFLKLHTHGAQEQIADVWLSPLATAFHRHLHELAGLRGFCYYYVTARQMAMLVGQAEQGLAEPDFEHLSDAFASC